VPVSGYKTAEPGLALVNRGTLPLTDEIVFPVRADRETKIGAITLFMNYDPSLITITGIKMPENGGVEPWFETRDGVLYIGWVSTESIRVEHEGTLLLIHARLTEAFRISHFTFCDSHLESDGLNVKGEMRNVETHCRASLPLPTIRFTLNENPLSELADETGNAISSVTLSIPNAGSSPIAYCLMPVALYPNPAKDVINVEMVSETSCIGRVGLFDMTGKQVLTFENIDIVVGLNHIRLDLRNLPNGAYCIRFVSDVQSYARKILINR
jgi:hypothetical protein